jgi:hypothetical protein
MNIWVPKNTRNFLTSKANFYSLLIKASSNVYFMPCTKLSKRFCVFDVIVVIVVEKTDLFQFNLHEKLILYLADTNPN